MKAKWLLMAALALVLAGIPSFAYDCSPGPTCKSQITANAGTVVLQVPQGTGTVVIQVSGTYSGTLQFEQSIDGGGSYVATLGMPQPSGAGASSTTSTGTWRFVGSAIDHIRVRASAWTSGQANIAISASPASAASIQPAFSNQVGTGYQDVLATSAPANPSSGYDRLYVDSGTGLFACLTSGGADCLGSGAGTVTSSGSPSAGNIPKFTSATDIAPAAYTDILGLWTGCIGTTVPSSDGTCITAGTGTVTVVAAGSLTSTALVTGGGTTTLQTPAATATMDASGNVSTPGSVTAAGGFSSSAAGPTELRFTAGVAPAIVASTLQVIGPTSVQAGGYQLALPGTEPAAAKQSLQIAAISSSKATSQWVYPTGGTSGCVKGVQAATTLATHAVYYDLTGAVCTVAANTISSAAGDYLAVDAEVLTSANTNQKYIQLCIEPSQTADLCTSGTTVALNNTATANALHNFHLLIIPTAAGAGQADLKIMTTGADNTGLAGIQRTTVAVSTVTWASGFVVKVRGQNATTDTDSMTVNHFIVTKFAGL